MTVNRFRSALLTAVMLAMPLIARAQVIPITRLHPPEDAGKVRARMSALQDSIKVAAGAKLVELNGRLKDASLALETALCDESLAGVRINFHVGKEIQHCLFQNGSLSPSNLTFYSEGGSLITDLYATTFFRTFRVALSALVASSADSTTRDTAIANAGEVREAVQQLIAGGGNLLVSASWPAFTFRSKGGTFASTVSLSGRAATEVSALGARTSSVPVNYATTITTDFHLGSDSWDVQAFGRARGELISGKTALELLLSRSATDDLRYLELSGGLIVSDLFAITATKIARGNVSLRQADTQVSITTVRSLK